MQHGLNDDNNVHAYTAHGIEIGHQYEYLECPLWCSSKDVLACSAETLVEAGSENGVVLEQLSCMSP